MIKNENRAFTSDEPATERATFAASASVLAPLTVICGICRWIVSNGLMPKCIDYVKRFLFIEMADLNQTGSSFTIPGYRLGKALHHLKIEEKQNPITSK